MLAVRKLARGVGNVEVQDVPEPHPGPGEVVVQVDSAGICGTDLHIYLDEFETSPPVTMGHEFAGVLAAVGPGVPKWRVGDRVTAETYYSTCGVCDHCRSGRRNLCLNRRSIGSKQDGVFARYVAVPAANLYRVPEEVDLESAALTEPLACVLHGVVEAAGVRPGDNVVVTGPGPIGLLALQVANAAGTHVVMVGVHQDRNRLALAKELGAAHVLEADKADNVVSAVQEIFRSEGADLAVECSGAEPAADLALQSLRRGGRFCQMGLFGKPIRWNQDLICYKEIVVTGTNASVSTAWPRALKLLAEGKINSRRMISHRFPVEEWEKALAMVRDKEGIKVVLKPTQ
jgi:L-iditol 2-dehydrogenase